MKFIPINSNLSLLFLRIAMGGFMLSHGHPKLMQLMAGGEINFPDPLHVGSTASLALTVFAEFFCAIAVLIGFQTRWAAFFLAFTMFIAGVVIHSNDPWGDKEHSLLYLFGNLAILFQGGGAYSLDGLLSSRK